MSMKKTTSLALSATFAVVSLSAHSAVRGNPFEAQTLDQGYQLAQADTKTQDGSCGGDKKKDGSCGAGKK